MTLMSVVLPAPLGPTTQTSSPPRIASEISHSAVAAPYFATIESSASMGPSEKCRHHVRLFHHFGRHTLGDNDAMLEHDDAVGERHDGAHHVLDEKDGRPRIANRADQLNGVLTFARR